MNESMTLSELIQRRHASGGRAAWRAGSSSYWIPQGYRFCVRMPPHCVDIVSPQERSQVMREMKAIAISYSLTPSAQKPANAIHFVCNDDYDLDRLSRNTRSKVRRGSAAFGVDIISSYELRKDGYIAASDTKQRVGGSRLRPKDFDDWVRQMDRHGYQFWAARTPDLTIAAWAAVLVVDNWALIPVERSRSEYLKRYCNNALLFEILRSTLNNQGVSSVSYGWSSLQTNSRIDSLSTFKQSMGFQCDPIHRTIDLHPAIAPLVGNRLVHRIADDILRRNPSSYYAGKIAGLMGAISK